MRDRAFVLALVIGDCTGQKGDDSSERPVLVAVESAAPRTRALAIFDREEPQHWRWSREKPARRHVSGRSAPVVGHGITPMVATMAFLTRFQDVFAIKDPAAHFRTRREQQDDLGMTHLRLQQVERGVPVEGAEMMAHYDSSGALRTIDSSYVLALDDIDPRPSPPAYAPCCSVPSVPSAASGGLGGR